jgi:hypothetical protein
VPAAPQQATPPASVVFSRLWKYSHVGTKNIIQRLYLIFDGVRISEQSGNESYLKTKTNTVVLQKYRQNANKDEGREKIQLIA